MYTNRFHSIDDVIRYTPNNQYNNNINYLISKSENYRNTAENPEQVDLKYSGISQKPTIYSENNYLLQENPTKTYYFTPEIFLKPTRPKTQFINTSFKFVIKKN